MSIQLTCLLIELGQHSRRLAPGGHGVAVGQPHAVPPAVGREVALGGGDHAPLDVPRADELGLREVRDRHRHHLDDERVAEVGQGHTRLRQ